MQVKSSHVIIAIVALCIVLFVVGNCTLKCKSQSQEGFRVMPLTGALTQSRGLKDEPVDHAYDWTRYNLWRAKPNDRTQQLENGTLIDPKTGKYAGLDLWDQAVHGLYDGTTFSQYQSNYGGPVAPLKHIINDEQIRSGTMNHGLRDAHNHLKGLRYGERIIDFINEDDKILFNRVGGAWGVSQHALNDFSSWLNPNSSNPWHPKK